MFRLNERVAATDFLRSRLAERALVEELEAAGRILRVGNVAVDVPNLIHRRFRCDTRRCIRVSRRNGRKWYTGSCCTDLVVEITPPERRRLKRIARAYLHDVPDAPKPLVKAARRILDDGIFAKTTTNEPCLDDHRTNRCILSYVDATGVFRCAAHAMILALGRHLESHKPDPCFAYPLHYVDYEPGRFFLTILNPTNCKRLGASKQTANMPCVTRPPADAPHAYVALRSELEHLWGRRFWCEIDRHARRLLAGPATARRQRRT